MSLVSRSMLLPSRGGRSELCFAKRIHHFGPDLRERSRGFFSHSAQVVELGLCSLSSVRQRRDLDPDVAAVESNESRLALERVSDDVECLYSQSRELKEDLLFQASKIRALHQRLDASSQSPLFHRRVEQHDVERALCAQNV